MELGDSAYKELFEMLPRPAWVFDRETQRILLVNNAAIELYGWSREEFLEKTLPELRPPGERAAFEAAYAAHKPTSRFGRVGRHWKKNGELIEVHLELARCTLAGRAATIAIVADVTGIADAERRFRLLVEHCSDGIALTTEDDRIEYMSPGAERILGYPASELVKMSGRSLAHLDDLVERRVPERGQTLSYETRVRHRDGSWRWIESSTTNLTNDPAVRAYVSNFRDVTQRKAAERALLDFRRLIERSPTAIFVHRDGKYVYANAATLGMLGFDRADEIIGRPVLELVHEADHDNVLRRIHDTATAGESAAGEIRMLRRDGSEILVETEGILIEFEGNPSNVVLARDVTAQRELFARVAMADRMVTVGTLAAGVAHEINNPLAYVSANLELLARELATQSADLSVLVAEAREGIARVTAIVRDLRALARPEDDVRRPVDVAAVLASSIKMAQTEIRHRVRIVEELATNLPAAHAHASRLGQVFVNLLLNAAQAIEGERGEIRVRARASEDRAHVIIEVEDTGVGIPPALLRRIFDPFFTTKGPGRSMGLGLAISHQIVRALDGELAVATEPGRGSTFTVTLPTSHGEVRSVPAPATRVAGGTRVLLIDDEPAVGRSLSLLLAPDYDVVAVTHAKDAFERLRGERFDVIVCDLMMPGISGVELYEQLAPADRERMIFMTGGAFTPEAREFLAALGRPYLEKPFGEAELRRAIGALVGGRPR